MKDGAGCGQTALAAALARSYVRNMITQNKTNWVAIWLWAMVVLVFCMVIVGGATRLTNSGLSITEWKPLLGAIPPLNEMDWQDAFTKYQAIPQYQLLNKGMSLTDFKFIYWWEWSHRFLGRFIGFAFAVPFLFFIATRQIAKSLWGRLIMLFVLGGAQGALGWYMVASGLVDRTDVSQYRLAAHLTLAAALFAAIIWTALQVSGVKGAFAKGRPIAMVLMSLLFLQIAAGGFVAGLDAGHASDTWPLMEGAVIPGGLAFMQPIWKNLFENALTVQFDHRLLAYLILAVTALQAYVTRLVSAGIVFAVALSQAALGVLTIVTHVPLHTALVHQAGALVLLSVALWHLKKVSPSPVQDQQ
jgi:heme a synthase